MRGRKDLTFMAPHSAKNSHEHAISPHVHGAQTSIKLNHRGIRRERDRERVKINPIVVRGC
jgi:hypothetical protein